LGFWYPANKTGFYAPTPVNVPTKYIFYFESLCVLSALTDVLKKAPQGSHIIIYTDNSNTVNIFQSYWSLPPYNHLLKDVVDIILHNDYSLCVLYIPGTKNVVTDTLSQVVF
ncbi:hypothetical protein BYT27DRAFT_7150913, partial [Phlegmacium glaucopus]